MVHWLPLESNPDVMNKFLSGLGVPSSAVISDVYGLEPELLAMVPTPVHALLLLYPRTSVAIEHSKQEEAKIDAVGQEVSSDLYYMKQFVGNACGTVAIVHALANNAHKIPLADGVMKSFIEKTKAMDAEARGKALETDADIANLHEECSTEGQTAAPDRETDMDTHFITLVNVGGSVYELDGRKKFPINHGPTTEDTFLQDGAKILKGFMERDQEQTRFAVVALTAPEN